MMPRSTPKPLLVGESNPHGTDPRFALYPAPDGCSGHRLCCVILGMSRRQYLESFVRTNLCRGKWSIVEAGRRAAEIDSGYSGKVILLGSKVAQAFGVRYAPFEVVGGLLILPHPSGLCRLWSEPGAGARAREVVVGFLPELMGLVGVAEPDEKT